MKVPMIINRVLLTLLGVATGAVKLLGMEQEMAIFAAAGFSSGAIVAFGVVQIVAALLLVDDRSARVGGIALALTFVVATAVLFINAMVPFGLFSLLFIAMAGAVIAKPTLGVFPRDRERQAAAAAA